MLKRIKIKPILAKTVITAMIASLFLVLPMPNTNAASFNPTHVGAITDDGTTALAGARNIYVSGNYAYVTAGVDGGVEILDISDPANPTHVGAITDDGTTALDGANYIYVSGNYAYVTANADDGVEILDISDPANPTHVGAIFDTVCDAAVGGSGCELDGAANIYISGNYAYVAAWYDGGVEILDISDPANPSHVGAIDNAVCDAAVGGSGCELDGAFDIYISGKYAYVTAGVDDGMEVLDISDPANPSHVGAITDDPTTALDGVRGIYISGDYAYTVNAIDDGMEILDISDPANPTHVGAILDTVCDAAVGGTGCALDFAFKIYVSGNYAYVTALFDDGVEVLDISDPANPSHVGAIFDDATTALNGAMGIFVSGNYAYVAGRDDDGVEVLDIDGIDSQLTFVSDTLSDSDLGVAANHSIGWTALQSLSAGEIIKIELDPMTHRFSQSYSSATTTDITATGMTLVDYGGCTGAANEAEVYSLTYNNNQDENLMLKVCTGDTISSGAKTLSVGNSLWTNPSTAGSYIIRLFSGDDASSDESADTRVAIIDDVNVTADISTAFTFTITGKTSGSVGSDSCAGITSTSESIPFGVLSSGSAKVGCQTLAVTTNAKNGFSVTVKQDQRLTSANGADIDTFADDGQTSSPVAWASPSNTLGNEATYGHLGATSDDDYNTNEFNDGAGFAGNLLSARTLFTHNGPADGSTADKGAANVAYKVEIGSLQEAANDYSATMTYVATPTF